MAADDITDYLSDEVFSRLSREQQDTFFSPGKLLDHAKALTKLVLESPDFAQDMYVMAERAGVITKKEILFVKLVEYSSIHNGGILSDHALRMSGYLAAAIFGESLNPQQAGERFADILGRATDYGLGLERLGKPVSTPP